MIDVGLNPETYNPEQGGLTQSESGRPEGVHSTGYRFMPLSTMAKENGPALICIAGAYPGITAEQLLAPQALPFAPFGRWNYHVLTSAGCSSGFVAVPGSDLLEESPNTVAVVCGSQSLGIEFPDGNEHEVLAMIDRSDDAVANPGALDTQKFYAFGDEAGRVHIRWVDAIPPGWQVLGRLIYTQMPFVGKVNTGDGFAEADDDFEF
jgi:hypothetical protein